MDEWKIKTVEGLISVWRSSESRFCAIRVLQQTITKVKTRVKVKSLARRMEVPTRESSRSRHCEKMIVDFQEVIVSTTNESTVVRDCFLL